MQHHESRSVPQPHHRPAAHPATAAAAAQAQGPAPPGQPHQPAATLQGISPAAAATADLPRWPGVFSKICHELHTMHAVLGGSGPVPYQDGIKHTSTSPSQGQCIVHVELLQQLQTLA